MRRRISRYLADRRNRRHVLLVALSVVAIAVLAAAKGLIGFYVVSRKEISLEVGIGAVAVMAAVFAVCQRRINRFLEAKFSRSITVRRQALAALTDELAIIEDTGLLGQRLVKRFDELLDTDGASLYLVTVDGSFSRIASTRRALPAHLAPHDPAIISLRLAHEAIVPADVDSMLRAPLAWPLRVRGRLIGLLVSGERDHVESFDAAEIQAVATLADAVAATLALLDPALVALPAQQARHNLPTPSQSFVGRARELVECRAMLSQARVLTLIGFGGTGKTRFALELAQEVRAAYPGGVWWVPLAAIVDPEQVGSIAARTLGVTETPGVPMAESIAQGITRQPTLLVLDDCEHLLPGCAIFVDDLLRATDQVTVLATSQQPLGVAHEHRYALSTFTIPDANETDAAGTCDAVDLFVERARAAAPGFAPDAASLTVIADICRRLDGLALAIELAAARVKLLGLEEIRDKLDDRFRLLVTANTASAHGRTLRASIEWTDEHLPPAERLLLHRMAVFAGGCTLRAATRVAHDSDDEFAVLEILDHLVEKSLIRVERDGNHAARYAMPHTLRHFARERTQSTGDYAALEERHLDFYLQLAEEAAPALRGGAAVAWLHVLDQEFANLQQAHAACARLANGAERGLRLARAFERYWFDRGMLAAGQRHSEEALRHPAAAAATALRAQVLQTAGALAVAAGNLTAAGTLLDEAEIIARALPAPDTLRAVLGTRGRLAQRGGDAMTARTHFDEALAIARAGLPPAAIAESLEDLGEHRYDEGDLDGAMRANEEALALIRPTGHLPDLHIAVRNLARLAIERRDFIQAATLLSEALGLALRTAARFDGEHDLETAAALASARGEWARAAQFAGAADAAATAMGSVRSVRDGDAIEVLAAAARTHLPAGAHAAAHATGAAMPFGEALAVARDWATGASAGAAIAPGDRVSA